MDRLLEQSLEQMEKLFYFDFFLSFYSAISVNNLIDSPAKNFYFLSTRQYARLRLLLKLHPLRTNSQHSHSSANGWLTDFSKTDNSKTWGG